MHPTVGRDVARSLALEHRPQALLNLERLLLERALERARHLALELHELRRRIEAHRHEEDAALERLEARALEALLEHSSLAHPHRSRRVGRRRRGAELALRDARRDRDE